MIAGAILQVERGEDRGMTSPIKSLIVFVFGLLLSTTPVASAQQDGAQSNGPNSKTVEYKSGQVWKTDLGATVTILTVEDVRKVGKIVHVRIDNVPVQSCGGSHLTTTIEHMALSEKMMRKSAIDLVKNNIALPDSYFDAYREWEKKKNHKVINVPMQEAILSVETLPGPMICNILPSQT